MTFRAPDKEGFFLNYSFPQPNKYCGYLKEISRLDISFMYPQYMFWLSDEQVTKLRVNKIDITRAGFYTWIQIIKPNINASVIDLLIRNLYVGFKPACSDTETS